MADVLSPEILLQYSLFSLYSVEEGVICEAFLSEANKRQLTLFAAISFADTVNAPTVNGPCG